MALADLSKLNRIKLDALGVVLKGESVDNEALRKEKEQEWLESLRQNEGEYDPDIITRTGMTEEEKKIYPGYTKSKGNPLKAKLVQHLIPDKDPNWDIKPTAIPSISQETLDYIVTTLSQAMQVTPDQLSVEQVEAAVKAVTETRAENMKVTMKDQLTEDCYKETQKKALYSGIDYGTGIIKGALSKPYTSNKITKTVDEMTGIVKFEQAHKNHYRPSGECVPIWNFFPDMTQITIDKCRFVDILRRTTKHSLKKLSERKDFFGDIITEYLKQHPKGTYRLRDWETITLTTGTHNVNNPQFLTDQGYNAAPANQSMQTTDYEVIERDCYLDGYELYEMGITDVEDVEAEYFCNVWLLGNKIIKIAKWDKRLCDDLDDIYHLFYYEKNETSIFGKGLPKVIRYEQLALAACDRNMLRNASWLAGPCGEVNADLLHASQLKDADKLYPGNFKIKKGRGADANAKVLNIYNVDSHITEFLAMKNDFRTQGDSDSSLPSYLFGDTSANSKDTPVSTSKMQFASMIDFIKNLVGNFDKMHRSYLKAVYKWNMVFNPDENIKGDMDIETIGSAAAIINEAVISQWAFLIQSLPNEAKDRIDWDAWLKTYGKLSGLPDYEKIVLSEEKYQAKVQQRQAEQERMLQIQQGLAQAKIQKDTETAKKTAAATAKITAETPHNVEGKAIENQAKVIDMAHKKALTDSVQTKDMLDATESIRSANEAAQ